MVTEVASPARLLPEGGREEGGREGSREGGREGAWERKGQ